MKQRPKDLVRTAVIKTTLFGLGEKHRGQRIRPVAPLLQHIGYFADVIGAGPADPAAAGTGQYRVQGGDQAPAARLHFECAAVLLEGEGQPISDNDQPLHTSPPQARTQSVKNWIRS